MPCLELRQRSPEPEATWGGAIEAWILAFEYRLQEIHFIENRLGETLVLRGSLRLRDIRHQAVEAGNFRCAAA